ncbi:MAG: single-stranded DNA-binding protein [Phycisphaerales bacterium]|nr:single-stranded DNA-binding protein [Phycisphaerales bacterium]
MANYNKVLLMGNLTRDIELRTLPQSNTSVANVGLAVNRRWRTPEGEQREETTFVDCDAFGKTAEMMSQYLRKGRPVFIEGRLKLDEWTDKESGQKRSKLKVVIETFSFIDSKPAGEGGGGGGGSYSAGRAAPSGPSAPASSGPYKSVGEEDIPF